MSWRRLFPLIFLFSLVDGFISNCFYPAKLPFLFKDILISIVYILFFITREYEKQWIFEFKKSVGYGIWLLAISLIFWGGLQIFNPHIPRIDVGILGFKTMFFYWPLAILSYAYVDDIKCLRRLLKAIVYFTIPICIFGIYQFWQDPHFMVRAFGKGFERAIVILSASAESGILWRVFGTFASTGQFSSFLVINIMFILALLFSARTQLEKSILIGCLGLNYVTILCTGSRAALLLLFPTTFLLVVLCRWLWRSFFIAFLLAISLNFGFNYLGKAVITRFETIRDTEMIRGRTIRATKELFKSSLEKYPFGHGMGTATPAARHLFSKVTRDIAFIENYPTKLLHELGIVGVLLFYTLLISLFIHWITHWLKFVEKETYVIISALTAYCWSIFLIAVFGIIDSPPIGIFLWTEIGIVARLATFQPNDKYTLST